MSALHAGHAWRACQMHFSDDNGVEHAATGKVTRIPVQLAISHINDDSVITLKEHAWGSRGQQGNQLATTKQGRSVVIICRQQAPKHAGTKCRKSLINSPKQAYVFGRCAPHHFVGTSLPGCMHACMRGWMDGPPVETSARARVPPASH